MDQAALISKGKTLLDAKALHQGTGQGTDRQVTTNVTRQWAKPRQELLTLLMCRVSELIAVAS